MTRALSLGFSPCPNDTFLFFALVHGRVGDLRVEPQLADVETLNQRAGRGELDLTKVSYGAIPQLLDRYAILRAGGALGRGCGPLLCAREPRLRVEDLRGRGAIAIPGARTTAAALLAMRDPALGPVRAMPFDAIPRAVGQGDIVAGVIIHELRFTYQKLGLHLVCDLGEWWERETGLPIPLGAILGRRELGPGDLLRADAAVRASVLWARAHPEATRAYVRSHAQELDQTVIDAHIALYVNEFSIDLGETGRAAVRTFFERASAAGLSPAVDEDPFVV